MLSPLQLSPINASLTQTDCSFKKISVSKWY